MEKNVMRSKPLLAAFLGFALCFAQEAPEKLAVYVSGAGDEGINKSLGAKLLAAMTQSGEYAEIGNPGSFQDEFAKGGNSDAAQVSQVAKRYGADYVCSVNMIEAFGAYSISARLIKTASSQIVKTGSADRSLKSLEDLTAVSNELARQLLSSTSVAVVPPAATSVPVAQKQCARMYNINELLFKVKDGFPTLLKDCSSTLAKDMVTPASLGGKKLEPKSFITQCAVDGIKKELPDGFPNADKILGSLTNFVQGVLNSAIAGGSLDPKKLVSAVGSMNVMELVSDVRKLAADECMVDEPYEPPAKPAGESGSKEEDKGVFSLGFRAGINASHLYETSGNASGSHNSVIGFQGGLVFDFALAEAFHLQPGVMFIQKGAKYGEYTLTQYYIEFPLLVSLKLWAGRLNAGPYFGFGGGNDYVAYDLGLSFGGGFDIGSFYIGAFYDYGLQDISKRGYIHTYNRSLVFNLGYNL